MTVDRRIGSLERQLAELRRRVDIEKSNAYSDDEIVAGLRRRRFDGRLLDSLFRVIKPGLLGCVIGRAGLQRWEWLSGGDGRYVDVYSPIGSTIWVVAAGRDLAGPRGIVDEAAEKSVLLSSPDEEKRRLRSRHVSLYDALRGLTVRLVRTYRLEYLQDLAKNLAEAIDEDPVQLHDCFPRVDQERWDRMSKLYAPLEDLWEAQELIAFTPEGKRWTSLDISGQEKVKMTEEELRILEEMNDARTYVRSPAAEHVR